MFDYREIIRKGARIYSYKDGRVAYIKDNGQIYSHTDGLIAIIKENGQIYSYADGLVAYIKDNGQIYSYKDGLVAYIKDNGQIYAYNDGIVAKITWDETDNSIYESCDTNDERCITPNNDKALKWFFVKYCIVFLVALQVSKLVKPLIGKGATETIIYIIFGIWLLWAIYRLWDKWE